MAFNRIRSAAPSIGRAAGTAGAVLLVAAVVVLGLTTASLKSDRDTDRKAIASLQQAHREDQDAIARVTSLDVNRATNGDVVQMGLRVDRIETQLGTGSRLPVSFDIDRLKNDLDQLRTCVRGLESSLRTYFLIPSSIGPYFPPC